MIDFLRILFFGEVLLMTPQPVDLYGTVEFDLKKPVAAITAGATLEIDVSSMIAKRREEGIVDFRQRVVERFPPGSLQATLYGENNLLVQMQYNGDHAYSDVDVTLLLASKEGVPTGVEFTRITIESESILKGVAVRWRNHRH